MPRNQTCHLITGQRYGFFTYGINRKNGININPTFFSVIELSQVVSIFHPTHILFKKCIHQLLHIGILIREVFVEDIIKRLACCINPDLAVFGQEPEDGVHSYHSPTGNYPIFFPMIKEGEDGDVQGRISTSTGRQLCQSILL